jgi:hypothetical protein
MDQIKASDVVKIIEACSKSGVVEIKLGELEVKFGPHYQSYPKVEYAIEESTEPQALELETNPRNPNPPPFDEDYALFNDPVAWDNKMRGPEGDDE